MGRAEEKKTRNKKKIPSFVGKNKEKNKEKQETLSQGQYSIDKKKSKKNWSFVGSMIEGVEISDKSRKKMKNRDTDN